MPGVRSLVIAAQFVQVPGRTPVASKVMVWVSPGSPGIENTSTSKFPFGNDGLGGVPTPSK